MTDRVHQMGLAQPDPPIEEKRVVELGRIVGYRPGGGGRELIVSAHDEAVEGVAVVDGGSGSRPTFDSRNRASGDRRGLGIESGTTTVFVIAVLVILAVLLQLSVAVSQSEERIRDLAESIALMSEASGAEPGPPVEPSDSGQDDPQV